MKFLIEEKEIKEADYFMQIAAEESLKSLCGKSNRGAVLVNHGMIIGAGYNTPFFPEFCCARENVHDDSHRDMCSAIHAEQMAIANATKGLYTIQGSRIYHIKRKNSAKVSSGSPSCTLCSRLIHAMGISEVVLLHDQGYAVYDSEEFNRLSYEYFLKK